MEKQVRYCIICGAEFETTIPHKKTCSDKCSLYRRNSSKMRKRTVTAEQRARRKEYDRQKYLKTHPDARTKDEIQKEAEATRQEVQKRKAEREAELARIRSEKERKKQENIAHWLEYEAEHECAVCGKKFIAHYPLAKYCSTNCSRKPYRKHRRYQGITVDKDITLKKLAKRDHNQCQICGLFVDWSDKVKTDKTTICGDMYPSIDHITPISLGGLHSWDNVQLAHRGCNTRKKNKYIG